MKLVSKQQETTCAQATLHASVPAPVLVPIPVPVLMTFSQVRHTDVMICLGMRHAMRLCSVNDLVSDFEIDLECHQVRERLVEGSALV